MVLEFIGFFGVLFASLFDLKTYEIPDLLNFLLFFSGFSFVFVSFLQSFDFFILINYFVAVILFSAIAFGLYFSRQWGGGDAKLLIALGSIFGFWNTLSLDSILVSFLTWFIFSILFYLFCSQFYLYFRHFRVVNKNLVVFWKKFTKLRLVFYSLVGVVLLCFLIFPSYRFIFQFVLFLLFLLFCCFFLLLLSKVIQKNVLERFIPVKDLTLGDWVIESVKVDNKVVYDVSKNIDVDEKALSLFRKLSSSGKLKKVKVRYGVPLAPAFLFAYVFTFLFQSFWFSISFF